LSAQPPPSRCGPDSNVSTKLRLTARGCLNAQSFVDLNFTHTRLGALVVALFTTIFAARTLRGQVMRSFAQIGLCLLIAQVLLACS
jgi:hypothetical protein